MYCSAAKGNVNMSDVLISRLCIIGVGLIGGSLARALRVAGFCKEVVGSGRNHDHLQQAADLGLSQSSRS